uniref:RING finger protein 17 n=1 Tax=Epinephelus lanceolatus TaxID=310571 RepID=UPI001445809B|nr:RING finger protein 17 [Epinephelus lanceolatus]XP_033473085.1 RING finger protein 17 [Epinephelus lanceolatus]
MMDSGDKQSAVICKLCGEAFTLPEDDVDGNLPRVLLCAHIYCTSCLLSIQSDGVIKCPECEVESTLPEGGVYGLQDDSRIIGLIYTSKMNKMKRCERPRNYKRFNRSPTTGTNEEWEQSANIEKIERAVDEALARAAENLALLEHIHETLANGLAKQVRRERARLEMEIMQAADNALHAIQKWKDMQMSQLTKLEARFSTSHIELCRVQERMKALETAMQMAREVRRVPFLEQYCTLDKVLETLQAPVDNQSFDMKCITMGSGISCVFLPESLSTGLALSLKMEAGDPKHLSESQPKGCQPVSYTRKAPWQSAEGRNRNFTSSSPKKLPSPKKTDQESPRANRPSSRSFSPSPRLRRRFSRPHQSPPSDPGTPDVIVEELYDEGRENAPPPTGPELANDKWRVHKRKKSQPSGSSRIGRESQLCNQQKNKVTKWVVVSHIVNPSHFYVRYLNEEKESESLSEMINNFCSGDNCCFTSSDTVETDSTIFVQREEGLWDRATVDEVIQSGCVESVKACPVIQLASIQVFLIDHGITKKLTIQSEEGTTKSSLKAVNNHLRKVGAAEKVELSRFAPLAIRCSLKDLVPYNLATGWSTKAQVEFQSVVGSASVELRILGQDRDSLLVDLRKAPVDQLSDVPISVREYLVFIEVARFYSPVKWGRRPLQYYPPEYPRIKKELIAVVSHINDPADFYIKLVDNMEALLLSAKLQDCYNGNNEDGLKIYCPVLEQACVARFEDKWYRAQVIGHPGGRKVEVRYVDFGNSKSLSVGDLRKIKDEFFALPAMAIHCCLSDVTPVNGKTWSDACTDRFISLADQKLVTVVATERVPRSEPLPVKLFESGLNGPQANIAELLVKEELASFKKGLKSKDTRPSANDSAIWDPPIELVLATENVDNPDQKTLTEQTEEQLEFEPQLKLPDQLKDLKVRVSHVNSPSSFYIQLTQYDSQLKRICELVKKECAFMERQDVVWKADMYCAALINGVWERGQICCDVTSNNIAEVMRCDHGNTVKLEVSNLRPLPSSLRGSLALECTLTNIRPAGGRSTWTATACESFSYYLTGASAVVTIKELTDERPVPVFLFCSNRMGQFDNIADFLTREGLALKERKQRDAAIEKPKETEAESLVSEAPTDGDTKNTQPPTPPLLPLPSPSLFTLPSPPKPAPRTVMSAEKVNTPPYCPPELPCPGHIQICVSAIGEDGLIYTRTQNAECQLEQLRERIHQSIKTLPRPRPYTWKSVFGCAVIGPDMLWYRGQLLEVLGGHVKVQYVDYGLVENIPVVHVYPMLLCDDVPQLCMPCQLHGINPIGGRWQRDALALLRELLMNRCVDMQVMELPTDPRGPLKVELFLDEMSLSRIMCHHDHGSMDPTVLAQKGHSVMSPALLLDDWDMDIEDLKSPEEPILGPFVYPELPQEREKFPVRVKHLRTPNELFLWPLEGTADVEVDGETLHEALSRINEDINGLPRLTNFRHGNPCLAEYSDGLYYRAKVIKFTSTEPVMIMVQHIDFGSDDTLPTSKLRQMPAELLQFPSRALKVKVAGFKAPSVNRQESVLPYSPSWSVKAVVDMIDLLHSNITASVVAQEPELTVLLYNENDELVHLPLVISGLAELE